jgi:hypothetical protein
MKCYYISQRASNAIGVPERPFSPKHCPVPVIGVTGGMPMEISGRTFQFGKRRVIYDYKFKICRIVTKAKPYVVTASEQISTDGYGIVNLMVN